MCKSGSLEMPSSLIIVALAAAWLIVLVPMVARKRQEVGQTGDDALAARIVRRGSAGGYRREEHVMSESATPGDRADDLQPEEPVVPDEEDVVDDAYDDYEADYDQDYEDARREAPRTTRVGGYRPGRGGFDPEAAEIAARAKYAFRQRVVLALMATVVISAVVAGLVLPVLWWVTGVTAATLATYLGYLRRQVRIETEIRQRRLDRLNGATTPRRLRRDDVDDGYDRGYDDYEVEYAEYEDGYDADYRAPRHPVSEERAIPGVERKPRPHSRMRHRNTVVVDIDDEDPEFEQLDEPGPPAYRRAVGE